MRKLTAVLIGLCLLCATVPAFGHGGGLDKCGQHRYYGGAKHTHDHAAKRKCDKDDERLYIVGGVLVGLLLVYLVYRQTSTAESGLSDDREESKVKPYLNLGPDGDAAVGLSFRW